MRFTNYKKPICLAEKNTSIFLKKMGDKIVLLINLEIKNTKKVLPS